MARKCDGDPTNEPYLLRIFLMVCILLSPIFLMNYCSGFSCEANENTPAHFGELNTPNMTESTTEDAGIENFECR